MGSKYSQFDEKRSACASPMICCHPLEHLTKRIRKHSDPIIMMSWYSEPNRFRWNYGTWITTDIKTKKRQNSLMCKWRPDSGLMSSCRGTPNQGSEVSAVGFLCSSQKRQRFGEKRVAMGRPVGTHTHTHAHTGIDG